MDYEGQICRAPQERASFMLPIMVGCSYNRCKFCNLFRHLDFRVLPLEQVEAELARVRSVGGNPKKVFLGDGNAFDLPMSHLEKVIGLIREYLPGCSMINMDATVTGIGRKTDEELSWLAQAGVSHLYLGIESGLDDVLEFMDKDHRNDRARCAIRRIQKAGMHFDAHIMTGIAGAGRGEENARALAAFLNETHPAHVVNFSLFLHEEVPLFQEILDGTYTASSELDNMKEELLLIKLLCEGGSEEHPIKYDGFHDFLGVRVRGTLPRDGQKMIDKLQQAIDEHPEAANLFSYVQGECPILYDQNGNIIYSTTLPSDASSACCPCGM